MAANTSSRSLQPGSRPCVLPPHQVVSVPSRLFFQPRGRPGFTMVELLVSITIVAIMAIIFGAMINQMNLAWVSGQERMQSFQNGRAILEIMSRELTPAVISKDLQFVQGPACSGSGNINNLLQPTATPSITQVTNSDSLFWQRPGTPNSYGNIYETGYFLITIPATSSTSTKYELARYNLAPNAITNSYAKAGTHASTSYWIYDPPTAYSGFSITTPWPEYSDAPWLTTLPANSIAKALSTASSTLDSANYPTSVVSDGVLALWIRCLDKNGDPIPWLYQNSLYSTLLPTGSNLKFNSAAAFNPAVTGSPSSFTYTAPPALQSVSYQYATSNNCNQPTAGSSPAANRLPSAVEITIITVDSKTLTFMSARSIAVPSMATPPTSAGELSVPGAIQTFMNSLLALNIKTAKVFTTTVRLENGTD